MRIECPSCAAAYEVPPERLAAGRTVKCARCATTWSPVTLNEAAVPAPPAPAVPPPEPAPDLPPEPVSEPPHVIERPIEDVAVRPEHPAAMPEEAVRRGRAPLVAAWVVSLAVLAALGWLAIDRRAAIMQAWPPSVRAYAVLGLVHTH